MTAVPSVDMSGWLHEQLDQASPDLLRGMVRSFAQALMSADADAVCGAGYGERRDFFFLPVDSFTMVSASLRSPGATESSHTTARSF